MAGLFGFDPARLNALAHATKDAIVDHYTDESIDLPPRRVVLPGLPAADCEMLGVHVLRVFPYSGSLANENVTAVNDSDVAFYQRGAQIAVYLVRCVPGLTKVSQTVRTPPTVEAEEAAAALIYADPTHVSNALALALDAGALPGCGAVAWDGWDSVTPQGKLGGGIITYRVSLE